MKKTLLVTLFTLLTGTFVRADLIWYDGFDYADGSLTNNSGGVWAIHSTSGANDVFVNNHRLELAGNSTTGAPRQADVNRLLCASEGCPYTNSAQVLYVSFTINCTNFPDADGGYFAHFAIGATSFQGKVFAQSSTNGLPNTWQLGVSGAQSSSASVVFPADLATNVDYQVVIEWDPVFLYANSIWVNPISYADPRVTSIDAVATPITATSFDFRQPSGMGNWFCTISNLAVATTFDEAATNVWSTNAVSPVMVYQPQGGTNFEGDQILLSAVANGQGQGSMIYDWYKNGVLVSNPLGNTNAYIIYSGMVADSGNYQMVATTPYGLSITSSVASLWVTNPPVPPKITQQPTNITVYFGQTATMQIVAAGVQPITYQWYFTNGSPVSGANFSGMNSDTLVISDVRANNGTTGGYYCVADNPFGPTGSSTGIVSAVQAPVATIGQLRTMVDNTYFLPTNTTSLWTVTGIVTSYTNMTTSGNMSLYMQDGTGGINVFFGGNTEARPVAGDSVTVVGPLNHFNSLLELALSVSDPAHSIVTNSSGNPLPAPAVLAFNFTNTPSASNAFRFYQSALVTLTNVYFPPGFSGTNTFGSGQNIVVTNAAGETFTVRIDARIGDIIGKSTLPYGWTVTGVMGYFLSAAATDRSAGYQLLPTRLADIVSQMPSSVSYAGVNPVISWQAGPNVPYSVLRATDVSGPYDIIVSGLVFGTTDGSYTDTTAPAGNAFYKITSP